MFELESESAETPMIDFGMNGKRLFQLPVLGAPGVAIGIMSSFSLFWDKFQGGGQMTEREVASAWNLLIQTLVDAYPDAARGLARLDEEQMRSVIRHWVEVSQERGGFDPDPKAG